MLFFSDKTKKLWATYVLISLTSTAQASTLVEALSSAYDRNPQLQSGERRLEATDNEISEAQSGYRPIATLRADGGLGRTSYQGQNTRNNPRSTTAELTQPVFSGGRTLAATHQAKFDILSERAHLRETEQKVLLDTATAYLDVLKDQQVLALDEENISALEAGLKGTNRRFEEGELTLTDVSQSQLRLSNAKADAFKAHADLNAARATYRRLVGDYPDALQPPALKLDLPTTVDEAASKAEKASPAVIMADYAERAARANIDLQRGSLYPEVGITADATRDYNDTSVDPIGSRVDEQRIVGTITVPLYQGGAEYSKLATAHDTANQRRLEYDNARNVAHEQAEAAWSALDAAQTTLVERTTEIEAAGAALKGVTEENKSGTRTILDVLDAEQDVRNAKVNKAQAEHDLTLAQLQLAAAIGRLTARDLQLAGPYYDPTVHYNQVDGAWFGG